MGEFATLLKSYGVSQISGDRFANVWPVEVFAKVGMTYEQNAEPKSTLYTNMLQLLNSRVELLDEPRSIAQLCSLERRTARSGRDLIDHPPGGHDDLINAVAGRRGGMHQPVARLASVISTSHEPIFTSGSREDAELEKRIETAAM